MAAEASRSGPSPGSYIGSLISLISKSGIRYEGIIYHINPEECTICLGNVHCFGTEGRKIDGPQIPPSEKIYDYVVFRGTNIKDLWVISLPPVETASIHNDPAIIQLHHSPMGAASTPGSATISDQSSQAVRLGHARSTIEGGLPLYQAGKNIEYIGSIPVANSSGFGVPRYSQGFYTPTSGLSHLPQTPSLSAPLELATLLSLPQHAQFSTINSSFPSGTLSLQEAIASLPPIVSSASTLASTSVQHSSIHSLFATTPSSLFSIPSPTTVAPTPASVFAAKPPFNRLPNRSLVNSHPASGSGLNIPLAPPLGYINTPGAPEPGNNTYICRGPSNESGPSLPFQTISQYMPSNINSFSSIKAETSLPIVTPGQLQHPSYSMLPSSLPVQTIQEDARFKEQEPKIKSEYEALTYEPTQPATSMKESLPKLSRSWFSGPLKLSEDFDFNAMNEKFNKAEVWGHLGHGKTLAEYDGQSSKVNAIQEEDEESLNPEIQPVYSKDDFFDNLSSKPFEPGTHSGTARVSEPLKVDMETSGDSRWHRSNRGGGRGFRDGNGGRWRSNHDRGDGSS